MFLSLHGQVYPKTLILISVGFHPRECSFSAQKNLFWICNRANINITNQKRPSFATRKPPSSWRSAIPTSLTRSFYPPAHSTRHSSSCSHGFMIQMQSPPGGTQLLSPHRKFPALQSIRPALHPHTEKFRSFPQRHPSGL